MINGPCQDCPDRCEGCHSRCEAYKAFKNEKKKENDWLRKWKDVERRPLPVRYNKSNGRWMNPDRGINRKERKKAR